jgi:hypothetical protein
MLVDMSLLSKFSLINLIIPIVSGLAILMNTVVYLLRHQMNENGLLIRTALSTMVLVDGLLSLIFVSVGWFFGLLRGQEVSGFFKMDFILLIVLAGILFTLALRSLGKSFKMSRKL